jgi:hypothetical protein
MEENGTYSLAEMVDDAFNGERIIVDDLAVSCRSISELIEIVEKAYKKDLYLRSNKQPWFDSNNPGENSLILLMKLKQLGKRMDAYHHRADINMNDTKLHK